MNKVIDIKKHNNIYIILYYPFIYYLIADLDIIYCVMFCHIIIYILYCQCLCILENIYCGLRNEI